MGRRMCGVGARRGFTILEMLVVIAIISVMASLLFPVLMSAREKARQATCASNLRQLGLGIDQYEQDNDDYGPGSPTNASGNGKLGGWVYYTAFGEGQGPAGTQFDVTKGSLYPYVGNANVYVCPDDYVAQERSANGLSYSMNGCIMGAYESDGIISGLPAAIVQYPSDVALLAEESEGNSPVNSSDDGYFKPTNGFSSRHNNGSEVLFVDLHVKWMPIDQLLTPEPSDAFPLDTYDEVLTNGESTPTCL